MPSIKLRDPFHQTLCLADLVSSAACLPARMVRVHESLKCLSLNVAEAILLVLWVSRLAVTRHLDLAPLVIFLAGDHRNQ